MEISESKIRELIDQGIIPFDGLLIPEPEGTVAALKWIKGIAAGEIQGPTETASEKMKKLVEEKMKGDPKMNYSQALAAVQRENPEVALRALNEIRPG